MHRIVLLLCLAAGLAVSVFASAADIDWDQIDHAIGRKGTTQPGGVHKFGLPRSDLDVSVDGVRIRPALALGSWTAFQLSGDGAMAMGDLVLTDEEISPVMQRLVDAGFEISAIHNHLLRMSTPVLYMHFAAHGDPVKLATTLHEALALSKTPLGPLGAAPPPMVDLDTAALEKALGFKGSANGGVYQFAIPRSETITQGGMSIPPSMGTAIALNFQPTGGGKAAISGDFVLLGREVNPVLRTLRANGIEVTALHSHMVDESPHLYFMHFWANADAMQLARALRTALDLTAAKRGP